MVIRWEAPPPIKTAWSEYAQALSTRRGEWALLLEGRTQSEARTAQRRLSGAGLKASTRRVDGEGFSVWAMFPPESA